MVHCLYDCHMIHYAVVQIDRNREECTVMGNNAEGKHRQEKCQVQYSRYCIKLIIFHIIAINIWYLEK